MSCRVRFRRCIELMPTQQIFEWKAGGGWLVLSGGADPTSAIRAAVIERSAADGGLACVSFGDDAAAEQILEDMQDLGAVSGYLVDVFSEDDDTLKDRLGDASIVVVSGGNGAQVRSALMGAALVGIERAYSNGGIVLVEGASVEAFGEFCFNADGTLGSGFGWLARCWLTADATLHAQDAAVQAVLMPNPQAFVMSVGAGSAFVVGLDVETWGNRQIQLLLGAAYSQS